MRLLLGRRGHPGLDVVHAGRLWSGSSAAVLLSLIKGWLVPGRQYDEVCAQRDKALEQVYKLAETASRAIEVVERRISPVSRWRKRKPRP
jgi:hypothetical protein